MERVTKIHIYGCLCLCAAFILHFWWEASGWSSYSIRPYTPDELKTSVLSIGSPTDTLTVKQWTLQAFDAREEMDAIVSLKKDKGMMQWSIIPVDSFGDPAVRLRFKSAWKDPFGTLRVQAWVESNDGSNDAVLLLIDRHGNLKEYTIDS